MSWRKCDKDSFLPLGSTTFPDDNNSLYSFITCSSDFSGVGSSSSSASKANVNSGNKNVFFVLVVSENLFDELSWNT